MSHEPLDDQQVGAMFEMMGGETVPKSMRGVLLADMWCLVTGFSANLPHGAHAKMSALATGTFKEVMLWAVLLIVAA